MSTLHGPIFMVASMAAFAAEDALIKTLSVRMPVGQVAIVLGIGGLIFFGLLAQARGTSLLSRQAFQGALLVRNLTEMVASVFMMLGIALAPLSVVSSVLQAMPLTVTMAAAVFLREPVGWRRWTAILVGFCGVLLILRPGVDGFDPYALLPLGAVIGLTLRDIATRRVPPGVASLQISGWAFAAVIPGGMIMMAVQGTAPVMPGALDWGFQALTLILGILGYSALVLATRSGDIGLTTPFRYSRMVFGMLIGVLVFGERPDAMMLVGAALVVAAGLYTLTRELRLRRAARR